MSLLSNLFGGHHVNKLPLNLPRHQLEAIPAIPVSLLEAAETLEKLAGREEATKQAKSSLNRQYRIAGQVATGYQFMYEPTPIAGKHTSDARRERLRGLAKNFAQLTKEVFDELIQAEKQAPPSAPPPTLQTLSLETPEQWAMSWPTFPDVYQAGAPHLAKWSASLSDATAATEQFWPTFAQYGLVYNLLILQKVQRAQIDALKTLFQTVWTPEWEALYAAGRLYVIDLSIFATLPPQTVKGFERFTPSTVTLLQQDANTKAITPIAVHVAGYNNSTSQLYTPTTATPSAWLYALQAAKTSITVYGIWLGHVYHWHIVTAAMQMTMYNTLPETHPLYQLLAPQSKYLIGFDTTLLLLWEEIAPPTSISTSQLFLQLCNTFATGRNYFDDDPTTTLDRLGLQAADFSVQQPWDLFPLVPHYLSIWESTETYIQAVVAATYADDAAVVQDADLQKWMKAAGDKDQGNIQGLPPMNSRLALQRVLTSLVYRITMHGVSRLDSEATPAYTFVANFPPCLQSSTLPSPQTEFDTKTLLSYLPKTGTLGEMMTFYCIFLFSAPYEPFVPLAGVETDLFFPEANDRRNQALVAFRQRLLKFVAEFQPVPQYYQWPLNIET